MKKYLHFIFICFNTILFSQTTGISSYYHDKFNNRKTASGEIFNNNLLTCAHKTLPFGTKIKVTNIANNKSVIVKVNDRGPFSKKRILDLTKKAFSTIGNINKGELKVKFEEVK